MLKSIVKSSKPTAYRLHFLDFANCHCKFVYDAAGLYNSENSKDQIINMLVYFWRGPQTSISIRCRDFAVVGKKF